LFQTQILALAHMKCRGSIIGLAVLALLALPVLHAVPALAWSEVSGQEVAREITPPPLSGSADEKVELAELKAFIAENASPRRLARARADAKRSVEVFLEGMNLEGKNLEGKNIALSARATDDLHDVVREARRTLKRTSDQLKSGFNRARPFKIDKSIHVCLDKDPDSQSFPSAHAAFGTMTAELLATAVPERATAFRARGRAYGESRNICGLHFLSDVKAGGIVGKRVAEALLQDAGFRAVFDPAAARFRKELMR
jgi:acid phosphatase (class A)